ncbi:hypothetical protein EJ065_6177 [Corallococcus coralloides]|uniref:DUF3943 domain-containing protein n=1 Tax=Corallococcus coralloides TaxID=184914 RepID=A0A410S0V6_CORCK|nr:DUF3943 domain-containing protein [Corallococcus coralloides]QAT87706.1 hypothetical protein EJ065_6177 [Corallococcus coralloides]
MLFACGLLLGGPAFAQEERCEDAPPLPADAPVQAGPPADAPLNEETVREDASRKRFHPWLAVGEITAINLFVWTWDRVLANKEWARVGPDSWKENLNTGFVWDADGFLTNQFAHPYHGSLYFTAARDNGVPYLATLPFTLFGSAQWELFAENEPPSVNDLLNTSVGGMAMGEALYRLSSLVLDTEARGGERFVRELTAAAMSPVRGFNRVVRGDVTRQEPTPTEWRPRDLSIWGTVGYLKLGDGQPLPWGEDQFFLQVALRYGDMYQGDLHQPFDAFDARVQFTTTESSLISHSKLQGLIAKSSLWSTEKDELRLGFLQQISHVDTQAYELGGQSLEFGLLHERQFSARSKLRTALLVDGSLITGISSEHSGKANRDYDYGPGLGLNLQLAYLRGAWEVLTLEAGTSHIMVLDGSKGSHQVFTGHLQADIPVFEHVGLGTELNWFHRHSRFDTYPDVLKEAYQLRIFVSVHY